MASDNQSSDFGRRYLTLPSSVVVRPSPARRVRATVPSNSPQICERSVYPVFNPLDPRHNPMAPASSWFDDSYFPPEEPSNLGSEGWMQSFSKRSIRKARSGLLALRSGMQKRPLVDGSRHDGETLRSCPWPEEYSDQKENIFPSSVSEASTEEDVEFGSHLHRTKCKSSPLAHDQDSPVPMSRFSSALADLSPFTRRSEESSNPLTPALTDFVLNSRVHESASENAEKSAVNASSGVDGSEIGRVGKTMASSRCVAHPSLDSNSPDSSNHSVRTSEAEKGIADEDIVVPPRAHELNFVELSDIDLMMDTLGALDRLNIHESPDMSLAGPGSNESSPGSPKRTSTGFLYPSRSSSTERESSRSNGEVQSNGSCNIRIQVQSGDWSRSLSPVPESSDLVDSNDFFGDQAAWSNRPSEEGTTTDITSVSNVLWSPAENEDLPSLVTMGDEFFLVDGKTSGFHPDRGDNPTKAERRLVSNDSLYSDPSFERNPSVRTQDIPEVIGPGSPIRMPLSGPRRRGRDASDSTDEYLVTYPLFLRRYLS
ncbi:hypothetical protein P170DRAFT_510802 [Aspergillus steynii IBT 23096]|uniref:Uncharacterized protein n=1 Tax=Aspergillus steynii IBT 23096 TaxID=1392250 RepID=A0A2I2G5J0_9EURO|nr:uncharacterized protein P170DRAFT_510802 [Aspergillus steynii IBT 23096]PLB48113.1 hypothetical protein P170DRAFT_510802 [Aspergillus steynii IBT 23096]